MIGPTFWAKGLDSYADIRFYGDGSSKQGAKLADADSIVNPATGTSHVFGPLGGRPRSLEKAARAFAVVAVHRRSSWRCCGGGLDLRRRKGPMAGSQPENGNGDRAAGTRVPSVRGLPYSRPRRSFPAAEPVEARPLLTQLRTAGTGRATCVSNFPYCRRSLAAPPSRQATRVPQALVLRSPVRPLAEDVFLRAGAHRGVFPDSVDLVRPRRSVIADDRVGPHVDRSEGRPGVAHRGRHLKRRAEWAAAIRRRAGHPNVTSPAAPAVKSRISTIPILHRGQRFVVVDLRL